VASQVYNLSSAAVPILKATLSEYIKIAGAQFFFEYPMVKSTMDIVFSSQFLSMAATAIAVMIVLRSPSSMISLIHRSSFGAIFGFAFFTILSASAMLSPQLEAALSAIVAIIAFLKPYIVLHLIAISTSAIIFGLFYLYDNGTYRPTHNRSLAGAIPPLKMDALTAQALQFFGHSVPSASDASSMPSN
jgi:hypothetical protein